MTTRYRSDPGPCLAIHPRGDEGVDDAIRVDDPERRIARPDQWTDLIDDDLEHFLDRAEAGDRPGRDIDGVVDIGLDEAGALRNLFLQTRREVVDDDDAMPVRKMPARRWSVSASSGYFSTYRRNASSPDASKSARNSIKISFTSILRFIV